MQICQGIDGTKIGARKDKHPSDNEEEEEGEQGGETFPKQGKAASVAEALTDTQAELEAQSAIPSSGKESGKESADSAKTQSDGASNEVIKWDWRTRMLTWRGGWKSWRRNTNTQIDNFEL